MRYKGKGPTLLILAAGVGSRYGGYKQLDGFGPDGETIMDYSIMDAKKAGFGEVVLVINETIEKLINETIVRRHHENIAISTVIQRVESSVEDKTLIFNRSKPWGTGHAVLVAQEKISTPFAVINADDYYGASSFSDMSLMLNGLRGSRHEYCMIGYRLQNTLSDHGGVSRGWCDINSGFLSTIHETKEIQQVNGKITGSRGDEEVTLYDDDIVSMNFWGFTPDVFAVLEESFQQFLKIEGSNDSAEFFISDTLGDLIKKGRIKIKVKNTSEKWFGVTYQKDRDLVVRGIQQSLRG